MLAGWCANSGATGRERERELENERKGEEAESQVIKVGNKPIDMPVGLQPPLAVEASFWVRIRINIPMMTSDRYL